MIRTDGTYQVLKAMQTVKQIGGDFRDVVMEVHGMWDKNAGSLERLGGKLTTSVGTARLWSINQLRFRDSNAIVNRCGSTFLGHFDAPRYPAPAKFELPPWNDPPEPPLPPDDPGDLPDQNNPPSLPPNIIPWDQPSSPTSPAIEQEPSKGGPLQPTQKFNPPGPLSLTISQGSLFFDADLGTGMPNPQGFTLEVIGADNDVPICNIGHTGALPPSMVIRDSISPLADNWQSVAFGMSTNKRTLIAWEVDFPAPFLAGTNVYPQIFSLVDTYTGNVYAKAYLTITTHKNIMPDSLIAYTGFAVGTMDGTFEQVSCGIPSLSNYNMTWLRAGYDPHVVGMSVSGTGTFIRGVHYDDAGLIIGASQGGFIMNVVNGTHGIPMGSWSFIDNPSGGGLHSASISGQPFIP